MRISTVREFIYYLNQGYELIIEVNDYSQNIRAKLVSGGAEIPVRKDLAQRQIRLLGLNRVCITGESTNKVRYHFR